MSLREERKNLYNELKKFYGAIGKVADKAGKHRNYVRLVLQQKEGYNNEDIWIAAAEVLIELKSEKSEKQSEFSKMLREAAAINIF